MYISLDSLKDIVCIQLDCIFFIYALVSKTITFSPKLFLLDWLDIQLNESNLHFEVNAVILWDQGKLKQQYDV
jgi:hypothetical protein